MHRTHPWRPEPPRVGCGLRLPLAHSVARMKRMEDGVSDARWAKVTKASRAHFLPVEQARKVTGLGSFNVGQLNPELFFVYTDTGTAVTQR